jgi:hypothetical protein
VSNVYGILAGILGIVGAVPYIYDTYRRKTKPQRFAWVIFLIVSVISFASQFSLGARASLFFFGWIVCNNVIIVALSLRKNGGYGGLSLVNVVSFCLALAGIVLWQMTNSPVVALVGALVADGIGASLIVVKSYLHPQSETVFMWFLGIISGVLNILAVGSFQPALLAFPVYLTIFDVLIVLAVFFGRRRHAS